VAVSGTSMVVGAPQEYANGLFHAGHVYVFSTAGSLLATLTSPNALVSGEFGWSVAVSGMNVVVGAPFETASGLLQAGHAYIFSSTGSLIATLTSPNAQTQGIFGYSVAVSGRSVIVGAPFENANGFLEAGHAYIFSTAGSLIANLTSPNAQTQGWFGNSVAISGMTGEVGAPYEGGPGLSVSGRTYTFSARSFLINTLTSPNALPGEAFGFSIAVDGPSLVVGALEGNPTGAGHAYLYATAFVR